MSKTFGLVILALVLLGCRTTAPPLASSTPSPEGTQVIRGVVNAGPTCPVETIPPDPNCADRPVAGAELWLLDDDIMVRRTTSAADGSFELALPPGNYQLYPQPVEGLMGTAPMQEIQINVGVPHPELVISYDTGIRLTPPPTKDPITSRPRPVLTEARPGRGWSMPRTPELTHAWMATRHGADSIQFVLLAVAERAGNSRLLRITSRPSGRGFATPHMRDGNAALLRTEFDSAVLDYLADGYTPTRRLEQPGELDLIVEHGGMEIPTVMFACCTHLHGGLPEWGMPRRGDSAPLSPDDRQLVCLLRPMSGTHGLLAIQPGQAGQAISFSVVSASERDSMQILAETLSVNGGNPRLPSWLGEVVVEPKQPAQVFDLLAYDGLDLRTTVWSQRRALLEQLMAELDRPDLLVAAQIDRRSPVSAAADSGLLWTRSDAAWNERQHQ